MSLFVDARAEKEINTGRGDYAPTPVHESTFPVCGAILGVLGFALFFVILKNRLAEAKFIRDHHLRLPHRK